MAPADHSSSGHAGWGRLLEARTRCPRQTTRCWGRDAQPTTHLPVGSPPAWWGGSPVSPRIEGAIARRAAVPFQAHRRDRSPASNKGGPLQGTTADTPNGIRTRVTALKGRGPRPLADGGARPEDTGAPPGRA